MSPEHESVRYTSGHWDVSPLPPFSCNVVVTYKVHKNKLIIIIYLNLLERVGSQVDDFNERNLYEINKKCFFTQGYRPIAIINYSSISQNIITKNTMY